MSSEENNSSDSRSNKYDNNSTTPIYKVSDGIFRVFNLTNSNQITNNFQLLYDSGAATCLVNNGALINVKDIKSKEVGIAGIGTGEGYKKMMCEGTGYLIPPLDHIPAILIPELSVNILRII